MFNVSSELGNIVLVSKDVIFGPIVDKYDGLEIKLFVAGDGNEHNKIRQEERIV